MAKKKKVIPPKAKRRKPVKSEKEVYKKETEVEEEVKPKKAEKADKEETKCACGEPALPNNHQCYKCSHRS